VSVVVESGYIILHFFVVPLSLPFARANRHKVELKVIYYSQYRSLIYKAQNVSSCEIVKMFLKLSHRKDHITNISLNTLKSVLKEYHNFILLNIRRSIS